MDKTSLEIELGKKLKELMSKKEEKMTPLQRNFRIALEKTGFTSAEIWSRSDGLEKRVLRMMVLKAIKEMKGGDFWGDFPKSWSTDKIESFFFYFVDQFLEFLNLLEFPPKKLTFALPSHPLMFTLIALFAGKPERIPRKLFEKNYNERTPEEQKEADEFLSSILTTDKRSTYDSTGKEIIDEEQVALVCDNPKVEARAEISRGLFSADLNIREGSLAVYIKRTFGAEGLRHLLGLIIGLEENYRQGFFEWDINEHLERLGYKKQKHGSFAPGLKQNAIEIIKIFTDLSITAKKKRGDKETIRFDRLFNIDGGAITKDIVKKEITDESLTIRATDFWYKNAFEPKDGKSPQYTKLLKKIARENHRNHPLTIYLAPLLAIFWRMEPDKRLSLKSIMEWCNLNPMDLYKLRAIKDLESELDYMKKAGYLGGWTHTGENKLPSECKDPLKCIVTFSPPEWLKAEIKGIEKKKEVFSLPEVKQEPPLSREEFIRIFKGSGKSQNQFANHLGISAQMVGYIIRDQRKISREISDKVKTVFEDLL